MRAVRRARSRCREWAVDHDLRDRRIGEEPLERAVAEDVVRDLGRDRGAVVAGQRRLQRELLGDLRLDPLADGAAVLDVEETRTELADEREVDSVLQLRERVARLSLPFAAIAGPTGEFAIRS